MNHNVKISRLEYALEHYCTKLPNYAVEDVLFIRACVPEIKHLPDQAIYGLWHNWGEYYYSANWFNPSSNTLPKEYIKEFRDFILAPEDGIDWIFDLI